ncbi:MAG TPA: hypothetical protein VE008_00385 [Burkholderiales bacterium]|nr:hypothetical protein [Burkholderiales bacterium]
MNMRVTVQNAANHGFSRAEVEAMLQHVPKPWSTNVDSVVLYSHREPDFRCTYYPKERILGLFWPSAGRQQKPSKAAAAEEMLLALSVIAEQGSLPERLSASLREEHLDAIASIRDRCLRAIGQHAA